MNIKLILAGIGLVVAIGIIASTASESSEYVGFDTAEAKAQQGDSKKYHVIGELVKQNGNPVIRYQPTKDPNFLSFDLQDNDSKIKTVVTYNPPASMQDFAKSEKVVVIGRMDGDVFLASEILMKCPSKYEENQNALTLNE